MAALAKEEPNEEVNTTTENKESDFNYQRPAGRKEDYNID